MMLINARQVINAFTPNSHDQMSVTNGDEDVSYTIKFLEKYSIEGRKTKPRHFLSHYMAFLGNITALFLKNWELGRI